VKISVDAAAGGALMGKSIEAAKALLEEMASNNYHWASERGTPKRGGGKHKVDAVTLLASRVDTLAQCLDKVGTPSTTSAGPSMRTYAYCEACGVQGHTSIKCTMLPLALNTQIAQIAQLVSHLRLRGNFQASLKLTPAVT